MVKYVMNAGNYLMDAAGYSLLTEIYHLSLVRIKEVKFESSITLLFEERPIAV